jgi:hypothetical protein
MSRHSPGPWKFGLSDEEKPPYYQGPGFYDNPGIYAANGMPVVACDEYNVFPFPLRKGAGMEERAANVRLLAAAPTLLKELRALVLRCDGAEGVRADGSNIDTCAAWAAIRLAEGESP